MSKRNENGFAPLEIALLAVIFAIIGFVVWYVIRSNRAVDRTNDATTKSSAITASGSSKSDKKTNTAADETNKTELKEDKQITEVVVTVPSNWKKKSYPKYENYIAQDSEKNIQISLSVGLDTSIGLTCSQSLHDSETITFANPSDIQPKSSYLTTTAFSDEKDTVCGMMLTGTFQAKKDAVVAPISSEEFQAQLPKYRVGAYISNLDNSTNYPMRDVLQNSAIYAEFIGILKSVVLK